MQVHQADPLQFGYLAQVIIIGEKLRSQIPRQPDQFAVHAVLLREIAIVNLYFIRRVSLNPIENLQAAAAARSFDVITGIGQLLQFL